MIFGLPYDAEVEWIRSDGSAYIDTGVKWNTSLTFDMTWYQFENMTFSHFMGVRDVASAGDGYYFGGAGTSSGGIYYFHFDLGGTRYNTGILGTKDHWYDARYTGSEIRVVRDGTNSNTIAVSSSPMAGNRNIIVCGRNNAGNIASNPMVGVRKLNLGSVRKLVAVRVGSVGYMYDRVTRRLFGNAGTGAFTLGPDVATPVLGLRTSPGPVFRDGTIFDVDMTAGQTLRLQPYICVPINSTQTYKISWGDGDVTTHVVHKTVNSNDEKPAHTYRAAGRYRISFTDSFENFSFGSLETSSGTNSRIVHIQKLGDHATYSGIYRSSSWRYFATNLHRLESVAFKSVSIESWPDSFRGCLKFSQYGDNGDLLASSLGSYLFNETLIRTIGNVPNATSLSSAFRSMRRLTKIGAIPRATSIGTDCFYNTLALTQTGPWPAVPPSAANANSIPLRGSILIPRGSRAAYESAMYWSAAASRLVEVDVG